MEATLFHNKSDRRRIDKIIEPIGGGGDLFHVEFLEQSSIINPILKISSGLEPIKANYLYLKDFNRFYFINNYIVCEGYIRLECEVDVLMSFAGELLKTFVLLDRNSSDYNLYLPDDKLPLEEPTNIRTIEFEDAFTTDTQFILVIAGSYDGGGE